MRLSEKVAVVVGTSPNIGSGIAEVLAREGAKLACIDFMESNALDCAKANEAAGGSAVGITCDVRVEAQVQAAIATVMKRFGRVDVLVNGVAIYNLKGVMEMTVDEFRNQIDVILTGAFLFTKHAARPMMDAKRGGSIIHIGSTEAYQGNPANVGYCTAKAGILSMARANAMEFAQHGIRVNSITPTATDPAESIERLQRWGRAPAAAPKDTRLISNPDLALRRMKLLPTRQGPSPADYGYAAAFLASDESKFSTGLDIRVDAGAVSKYWGWTDSTVI
jgi:NAD(P)-dependent dehydrogenase (short-subunit alcohol dehydrogenase family)